MCVKMGIAAIHQHLMFTNYINRLIKYNPFNEKISLISAQGEAGLSTR